MALRKFRLFMLNFCGPSSSRDGSVVEVDRNASGEESKIHEGICGFDKFLLLVLPFLKTFLPLPRIPIQCSRYAANPILAPPTLWQNISKRKSGCRNRHIVAGTQLDPNSGQ